MVRTLEEVGRFTFFGEGDKPMLANSKDGSWFMIMVSWEMGADGEAVQRFHQVYKYLNLRAPGMDENEDKRKEAEKVYNESYPKDPLVEDDPVYDIVQGSLKPLNLIGRRKLVIICQTPSNRVLQRLSKMISLNAHISVEIFPATYVTELRDLLR